MEHRNEDYLNDIEVRLSDLMVATCDGADHRIDPSVRSVLRLMRDKLGLDIVFVADANRAQGDAGSALEAFWGERAVRARMPSSGPGAAKVPAPHLPAIAEELMTRPVLLEDGSAYGTLCCFSAGASSWHRQRDRRNLQNIAAFAASTLRSARVPLALEPAPWSGWSRAAHALGGRASRNRRFADSVA
jgi:hypothetical protein